MSSPDCWTSWPTCSVRMPMPTTTRRASWWTANPRPERPASLCPSNLSVLGQNPPTRNRDRRPGAVRADSGASTGGVRAGLGGHPGRRPTPGSGHIPDGRRWRRSWRGLRPSVPSWPEQRMWLAADRDADGVRDESPTEVMQKVYVTSACVDRCDNRRRFSDG